MTRLGNPDITLSRHNTMRHLMGLSDKEFASYLFALTGGQADSTLNAALYEAARRIEEKQ